MHIELLRKLDLPIRSELFSAERLEQHGKSLAEAQPVGRSKKPGKSLRRRLKENSDKLIANFRVLARAAKAGNPITSAGEWFLDNFYIVEEQIREVRNDLPADYYNELPKLSQGPLAGFPRVYGIAWALIAHTDGAIDIDRLERFVRAYQDVDPLKIGELWAIAITLRITLVENLRRLTDIVVARAQRRGGAPTRLQGKCWRPLRKRTAARPTRSSTILILLRHWSRGWNSSFETKMYSPIRSFRA